MKYIFQKHMLMKHFSLYLIGMGSLLVLNSFINPNPLPGPDNKLGWNKGEKAILTASDTVMRVLTVKNKKDSLFLRRSSADISPQMIQSEEYRLLVKKMIATVSSPSQDGVGLAGPQVGLSKRVVAVQRFDKEGQPFEVYPNIRITGAKGQRKPGPEGCLSVPGQRAEVKRYQNIDITYTSPLTLRDTTENIKGFTAVIFQHECDHLDGILYTDYLKANDNNINDMEIILDVNNGETRRITAIPAGVCSRQINIVLKGDTIESLSFLGGCDGNLKGICSLLKGQKASEAISRLKGITCGRKSTSCPDQLAKALEQVTAPNGND